jgi:hypothetical protein
MASEAPPTSTSTRSSIGPTTGRRSSLPPKDGIDFDNLPWNLNHVSFSLSLSLSLSSIKKKFDVMNLQFTNHDTGIFLTYFYTPHTHTHTQPEEHTYVHLTTTTADGWTKEHYDLETDQGKLFDSVYNYDESPLPLSCACASLNYGTTIWEGLKCYRDKNGDPIVFRPDRNFYRFQNGAEQMSLPPPSRELFLRGIQHTLQQNSHIIPPHGEGMKLYVRPMLLGSGQQLGLYPSSQFSLLFYVSPTVSTMYCMFSTVVIELTLSVYREDLPIEK